ncbi:helix-turn-helix domain-containing protein [Streptomyces sp. p1417]|uniref:Helix-turn-helix domain-containing protein n=1 Tax=Streptomyces typhae TaxID=2681492 RepID=A0A6L6WVA4_9ACTN|nr:helix-turn-helix domain-containing protein [Streptomyces typhae]
MPLRPAPRAAAPAAAPGSAPRQPLWRDLVGNVLRRERQAQERTLKDVADAARISVPYLSEVERGRKEASSEVLAAAAAALGLDLADLLALAHGDLLLALRRPRARGGAAPVRGRAVSTVTTPLAAAPLASSRAATGRGGGPHQAQLRLAA